MKLKMPTIRMNTASSIVTTMAFVLLLLPSVSIGSAVRSAIRSGNFSDPTIWSPIGVPATGDLVSIASGSDVVLNQNSTIQNLSVQDNGRLRVTSNNLLTINGTISVMGRLDINEGNINLTQSGTSFVVGPHGTVLWAPADNTIQGATLFTNGVENFDPTSTLIIYNWYNYTNTPLGSVVTGSFGNLVLSTLWNGMLFEWDQKNQFQSHPILGKLTIDQGWVVLDKTGQITNTTIGSIELANSNSYLDFHSGTHNGTIVVNTSSIINNGGTLNGVVNGNANVTLNVSGDFSNSGSVRMVFNNGQANTGKGNAIINIHGKLTQTAGDFRGIFNISAYDNGTVYMESGSVNITGGNFILQYALHQSTGTSTLKVNGDLNIDLTAQSDIFRVGGLTSIANNQSSLRSTLIVGGNMNVNGLLNSEITSSVACGAESVSVNGNTTFNGGKISFNQGAHATVLNFNGNVLMQGGTAYLSKTGGLLNATIHGNLEIGSGQMNVRGANGAGNLSVTGNFIQHGGEFCLYNHLFEGAVSPIEMNIAGNLLLQSGIFRFNKIGGGTEGHTVKVSGATVQIENGFQIANETGTTTPVMGNLIYNRAGSTLLKNRSQGVCIQGVRQIVGTSTTLLMDEGNLQTSSLNTPITDAVSVDGILDMGTHRIASNRKCAYTGLTVNASGKIRIASEGGLYSSAANSAIDIQGNFCYQLASGSTIEYYGNNNQVITGTGEGTAITDAQKYSNLEINKSAGNAYLLSSGVVVKNQLRLTSGELDLHQNNLTINNNNAAPVVAVNGFIRSESSNMNTSGLVVVKNPQTVNIRFGKSMDKTFDFFFRKKSGTGDLLVSTNGTLSSNRPLPASVTNLNFRGNDAGNDYFFDRFYFVKADGMTADVTIGCADDETTPDPEFTSQGMTILAFNNNSWTIAGTSLAGTSGKLGASENVATWGYFTGAADPDKFLSSAIDLTGNLIDRTVQLVWTATANTETQKYVAERSIDGIHFQPLFEQNVLALPGVAHQYSGKDQNPPEGATWYRIREVFRDGTSKFTRNINIQRTVSSTGVISITQVNPSPFNNEFTLAYNLEAASSVEVILTTANGKPVFRTTVNGDAGTNIFRFTDGSNLAAGIYVIRISNGKSSDSKKIIKLNNGI